MGELAEVRSSCGRYYLSVAGCVVAMEGDKCRDNNLPESVLPPIPPEELEHATIGGKRAKDLPIDVVRFFWGDRWNLGMLEHVASRINNACPCRPRRYTAAELAGDLGEIERQIEAEGGGA